MRNASSNQQINGTTNRSTILKKSNSQVIDELSSNLQSNTTAGVANIPNQVHYHHSKRKININVLLFGENGLGKTGFINHVLGQPIFQDNQLNYHSSSDVTNIRVRSQEIEEAGNRALLSIIDLPNFGSKNTKKEAGHVALTYLQDQFETNLRDESQLRRQQKDSHDYRVHTILYFHNPTSHKLSHTDIELIDKMSKLANVLVIVAKGDTLLRHEFLRIKNNMREQLSEAGIKTFQSSDPSNSTVESFEPFICVSGADLLAPSPARNYTWGSIKINTSASPATLNINNLTNLLFKDYLPDLILDTDHKYEYWKAEVIRQTGVKEEEWKEPAEVLNKIVAKLSELKMIA